jgi:hypothetical protein
MTTARVAKIMYADGMATIAASDVTITAAVPMQVNARCVLSTLEHPNNRGAESKLSTTTADNNHNTRSAGR